MTPRARRTTLAASGLAGVFLFLATLAAGGKMPPPLPVPPTPPVAAAPPPTPVIDSSAIGERPLFSPSRRPAPPPMATPPEPLTLPAATLIAVAVSPERREAVLRPAAGKTVTVSQGSDWQGWTVTEIAIDKIRFRRGANEQVLAFPKPPRLQIKAQTAKP